MNTRAKPHLCWVVPDISHYHHARIHAFAVTDAARVTVLELCDTSGFKEFKFNHADVGAYRVETLFRNRFYTDVPPREAYRAVALALERMQPALLLVQGWSDIFALAPLLWRQAHLVPAIVTSESQVTDEPRARWKELVKQRIVGGFSAGLVGGKPHVEYLAALGMPRERIFTGYDAVDNEHFARGAAKVRGQSSVVRSQLGLPEHFFLASARFVEKKNLPRLLQAYARYRELAAKAENGEQKVETGNSHPSPLTPHPSTPPWSLVLLGDGPLRDTLNSQLSTLNLHGCVHLPGFKQYDELPTYYGLAGAFVHTSTVEQWGLVVNEAMASGLPVLVSNRCGCAPDLVQEGVNGFTFDPYNVEQLAQLMLRLTSMPKYHPLRLDRGEDKGEVSNPRNQSSSLSEMGSASRNTISAWGPQRFAQGLKQAVECALKVGPKRTNVFDHWLLQALLRR